MGESKMGLRSGGLPPAGPLRISEQRLPRIAMKEIQLGTRVRIVDGAALDAASEFQPEPGQVLWAGRESYVTDYRHGPDGRPLYALKGAPGLWLEDWIELI